MKIETQSTDNHQVTLTIEVEPEEFERAKRRAARSIARKTKIPGFRPGKAPYEVIVRHVGEAAVLEQAIDSLADELYPKALDEAQIDPGAPGTLEEITTFDPLTLVFTVPLKPEVSLGDYKSLRLPYEYEGISDEAVDEFIEMLRQRQAVVTTVERPAEEGDLVHITLNAERLDAAEGEETALLTDRHFPVLIEPEDADEDDDTEEWPFPGFSRLLLGMSAGEEKEVEHQFEEDCPFEAFQGAHVRFRFQVEKVTKRELPEVDDEFAQSMGDFETAEEFRAEVRQMLDESERAEYEHEYANAALDALVEQSEIKFPPETLERELEDLRRDFERRLETQGLTLESYLQVNEQSEEEFEQELRDIAEKRVRRSLVLYELAQAEDVQASEQEVQEGTMKMLDSLASRMPEKEFRKLLKSRHTINDLVSSVMMDVVAEKTTRRLSLIAQGKGEEEAQEEGESLEEADEEAPAADAEADPASEEEAESAPAEETPASEEDEPAGEA